MTNFSNRVLCGFHRALASASNGYARAGRRLARQIDWDLRHEGGLTVLSLTRALFAKDLAELKQRTSINWPTIHVKAVKAPQEDWVPEELRRQSFFNHDLKTTARNLREPLGMFGRAFLTAAQQRHRIDAVMAANTDYWQDEALRIACTELGIPFIVLSRESYGIGRGRRYVAENYGKGHFHFDGIACAVASRTCEEFMGSLPAMRDSLVRATGWPRYDPWRDLNAAPLQQRRTVTLMAYGDPRQLQYAAGNFREVLGIFVESARRQTNRPESDRLCHVIKIKKANEDGYIRDLVPDLEGAGVLVTADIPLPHLISQSRAVIGYNTLAVLEALLGDCAVIVPFWGDADRAPTETLLHPDKAADAAVCYFPRSVGDYAELSAAIEAGTLPALGTRQARLDRFSQHSEMSSDLTASARVEQFVRDAIALAGTGTPGRA